MEPKLRPAKPRSHHNGARGATEVGCCASPSITVTQRRLLPLLLGIILVLTQLQCSCTS